jgi:gamma-glutamylcyclotransferase (GGCT)/AIG2-like uncharacterized protein YtfP
MHSRALSWGVVFGGRGWRGRKPGWSTDAQQIVDQLFVYGTLREGQAARSMIENYVAASRPATIAGAVYAFPDGYPGVLEHGRGTVMGELVKLTDLTAAFALLDAYEGDDFIRILKVATLDDRSETFAWCYVLADERMVDGATLVDSGDWVDYDRHQ